MFRDCSICSAPPEVFRAVNEALGKREKLRTIAARSGFSKSALGRHKLKCMPREVLSSYKAARYNPQTGRLFVRWPDDPSAPPEYRGKTFPSHRPITENDVLLTITYDAPVLDQHGRYVHPGNVYQAALLENAERDAERSSESEQLNDCGPSQ